MLPLWENLPSKRSMVSDLSYAKMSQQTIEDVPKPKGQGLTAANLAMLEKNNAKKAKQEQTPADYDNLPSVQSSLAAGAQNDSSSFQVSKSKQTPAAIKKLDLNPKNDASKLILHTDEASFTGNDSYRIEIGANKKRGAPNT